jgi:hypothetical protein
VVDMDGCGVYFLGVVEGLWPRGVWRVVFCEDGSWGIWLGDLLIFSVDVEGCEVVVEWVGDLGITWVDGGSLMRSDPESYVSVTFNLGDHESVVGAFVEAGERGGFCG